MSSDYSIVIGFIIIILIFMCLHYLQTLNSDKIESYAAAPNPMQSYQDMYSQSLQMMLMPWISFACPNGASDKSCTLCNCDCKSESES